MAAVVDPLRAPSICTFLRQAEQNLLLLGASLDGRGKADAEQMLDNNGHNVDWACEGSRFVGTWFHDVGKDHIGGGKADRANIDDLVRSLDDRVRILEGSTLSVEHVARSFGQRPDSIERACKAPVSTSDQVEGVTVNVCAEIAELHDRTKALMQGDMLQTEELRKQRTDVVALQQSLQRVLSKDIVRGDELRSLRDNVSELREEACISNAQHRDICSQECTSLTSRVELCEGRPSDGDCVSALASPQDPEVAVSSADAQMMALWAAIKILQDDVCDVTAISARLSKVTELEENFRELEKACRDRFIDREDTSNRKGQCNPNARIEEGLLDELTSHRDTIRSLEQRMAEQASDNYVRGQELTEQAASLNCMQSRLRETLQTQQAHGSDIEVMQERLSTLAALEQKVESYRAFDDEPNSAEAEIHGKVLEAAVAAATEAAAAAATSAIQEEEEHVVGLLEAHRLQVRRAFRALEDRMNEVLALSERGSLFFSEERSISHSDYSKRSHIDIDRETAPLMDGSSKQLVALTERVALMDVELRAECEWLRGELRVLAERSSGLLEKHHHRNGDGSSDGVGGDDVMSSTVTTQQRYTCAAKTDGTSGGGGAGACSQMALAERVQQLIREQRMMTELVGQRSVSSASSVAASDSFASWPTAHSVVAPTAATPAVKTAARLLVPGTAVNTLPARVLAAAPTMAPTATVPAAVPTEKAVAPTTEPPTTSQQGTTFLGAPTAVSHLLAKSTSDGNEIRNTVSSPTQRQPPCTLPVVQPASTAMTFRGKRSSVPGAAQTLCEEEIDVEFHDVLSDQHSGDGDSSGLTANKARQPSEDPLNALLASVSRNIGNSSSLAQPRSAMDGVTASFGSSSSEAASVLPSPADAVVACSDVTLGGFDSSDEWPEARFDANASGMTIDTTAAREDGHRLRERKSMFRSFNSSSASSSGESQLDTASSVLHDQDVDAQLSAMQDHMRCLDESLESHTQAPFVFDSAPLADVRGRCYSPEG
eukprot:TRINITY_DN28636_c0_g1_i1.p1 TRINITY_DN28636_c0_g1~~TRINITY_DN28636_c0_g1_i1.p1  ORF type:complete len:1001 (+),score=180.15 TRINITY_DN28636_c0_g1_i1:101-3103(+)